MRIELINTGSELLLGFTVNTHANYIAGKLAERGLRLIRQTTVGDDREEMRTAVAAALGRSDIILITGGLGPTSDDFTRDVVAELLGQRLIHNPAIATTIRERFRRRNREMPESVLVQALVPEGATVLENPNGTAPGLHLVVAAAVPGGAVSPSAAGTAATTPRHLYLLPGPPRELKPMFEQLDLPRRDRLDCRVFKVARLPESIVEEKVAPALKDLPGIELGYCARMGEVEVRVLGENLDEAERRIRAALGVDIFGGAADRLEEVVIKMLAGRTLATAESCTGGLIANRLTNVSGSSAVFLTGYVTYSNEAKMRLLGVREETLKQHGAVSEETCREMAEGARRHADFALATTGIAGPTGGTAEKPVGLVFIGLATPERTVVERHQFQFDREAFKQLVAQYAIDAVRRELLKL